ncbi:MAG: FAD-linked oxidase C-terminal domain-containing protein, partial [Candidatus Thermoplasmatota archaeon]|nr:FAD-linked oxidase C-terminal domain-containing protein [Candidatus Thermoplasmatota archaeon]
ELYKGLAMKSVNMGGTISGEHGVGKKTVLLEGERVPYLQLMYGVKGLEEISRIKSAFDPCWILNPGNMILPKGVCN